MYFIQSFADRFDASKQQFPIKFRKVINYAIPKYTIYRNSVLLKRHPCNKNFGGTITSIKLWNSLKKIMKTKVRRNIRADYLINYISYSYTPALDRYLLRKSFFLQIS